MRLGLVILLLLPFAAQAGALPEPLQRAMARNPQGWAREAAALVRGYGDAAGVDGTGIARFIAVERAAARARTLGWLAEADFDFDGQVSVAEGADYAQTLSVRGRAGFGAMVARADTDKDGVVSATEAQAVAAQAADRRLSPARIAALQALMALDGDGNGRVSLTEVQAAVPVGG